MSQSTNNKLGTLGPEFSFHDILCKESLSQFTIRYFDSFQCLFEALQNDQIQLVLVATRNSIHGDVSENAQTISNLGLKIIESFDVPISLHLAAKEDIQIDSIKKIYAHKVAWNECKQFLNTYTVQHIESSSNSQALIDLKNNSESHNAAISGLIAIKQSGLTMVQNNIHNQELNITTFSLVTKK